MPTVRRHAGLASGVLQGFASCGPGSGHASPAEVLGGVVEPPLPFGGLVALEQRQLSFHAPSVPRGCDSEATQAVMRGPSLALAVSATT